MITRLISDIAPKRITKRHMFNKISSNDWLNKRRDNSLFSIYYTDHIIKRARTIRRCAKKKKRFSWFNNTDTFANFALDSNLHKLTGLPFSSASSKMHDECYNIGRPIDIF